MELWTEYEGRTIDGAFALEKLLLPEGRSAFFSTSNGKGEPTVIRLIASHFDEDEILARWRGVEALGHPNILKLERYGQLELDGTTVVYAVMEPVDANLAEVISGQRLTIPEARQLATSLGSALAVLHGNGFVHEHVEAANVFAVGEVVKLRGDCIRESPEGQKGLDAKRRDIHDLAVVLLQALTQQQTLEAATREVSLPAPFDLVVRNGMSGTWGLAEIASALQAGERTAANGASAAIPRSAVVLMEPRPETESKLAGIPEIETGVKAAIKTGNKPGKDENAKDGVASVAPAENERAAEASESGLESEEMTRPISGRMPFLVEEREPSKTPTGRWAIAGIAAVLVLLLVWLLVHRKSGTTATAPQSGQSAAVNTAATPTPPLSANTPPAGKPTAARTTVKANPLPTPTVAAQSNAASGVREQWRVVAFTYNHEDQARKKVATVAQKHAGLRPEVFTPTGRAPYLVTIGGAMSRDQAFALAQKVKKLGLPRDSYAQNYGSTRR